MSWKGTFKKLEPGDQWSQEERIIGVLVNDFDSGVRYETIVDKEIVEDDGKPFEEGEEIEILIRRVNLPPSDFSDGESDEDISHEWVGEPCAEGSVQLNIQLTVSGDRLSEVIVDALHELKEATQGEPS